jgi:Sigma-70, region 4
MKAMRSAGCTLQQIGETFGITAERVRQLLHGMPQPKVWSGRQFARAMKHWLREAGYRKCSDCGLWKPDNSWSRCKDCNRRQARKYYATHREHCLAAAKRLRDKNYRSASAGQTQNNAQES